MRLTQEIVDKEKEEGVPLFKVGASYPIWTPLEAFDAVAPLMKLLETANGTVPSRPEEPT